MKSNTDLMTIQRGVALLPFMPNILSRYTKDSEYVMSIFYKTICKLKPKFFRVKSVTPEYFEQLLSSDASKKQFIGDIKSCALLSINTLAMAPMTSKLWIKIKKFETESSTNAEELESRKKNMMSYLRFGEGEYFLQCYGVASIHENFVLYVTNEKYFDLVQSLHGSVNWNENLEVHITGQCDIYPGIAESLAVSYVNSGVDMKITKMEEILHMYFRTPKHLKKSEVFQINVQKLLPYLEHSVDHVNVKNIYFKVLRISGSSNDTREEIGYYVVDKHTEVILSGGVNSYLPQETRKFVYINDKNFYEIPTCPAGLDEYYTKLLELFKVFLNGGNLSLRPMILLNGVRGSGKKTVLKCIASKLGLHMCSVNCFDYVRLDGTAFETKFRPVVTKVSQMAPAIFHLENIDLVGRDENYKEEVTVTEIFQKVIGTLFMERLSHPVIVVGSCSQKITELVPSIERMFIQTVSFKTMKKNEAEKLLNWLVHEAGLTCYEEILREVAKRVNGYLFADIVKLIRIALKYQREDKSISEKTRFLTMEHMKKAIDVVESHYSESIGSAKVPSVHWDDVGGLDKLKEEITLSLNFSTNHPELMASGLRASGFLFYGPPGTGKTLMAKAVATEFNYNFLSVKGPELMNMYVGQSEKNVREVFQRAREAAPCVIFFDELDSLAPNRGRDSSVVMDRIVSQLLTEMDGLESNAGVFVIGATNRPDLVDPGLLRPGRFDKMFYVGICSNKEMKLSVIKALTRRFTLDGDVDLEKVVDQLPDQVTGADIYSICSNSWLEAARRYINKTNEGKENVELPVRVNLKDFEQALTKFVPSLTPEIIRSYEKFKTLER